MGPGKVTIDITAKPRRTAVIAGSGLLPELLAGALHNPFVIGLSDDCGSWLEKHDHTRIEITRLGSIFSALRGAKVDTLLLAGGVKIRPRFSSFRLDWTTIKLLPTLFRALRKGDDGLLRAVISWFERNGFKVVGAHEILPDLLTPYDCVTKRGPSQQDEISIAYGISAALELGAKDIGQAAVAKNDSILALEQADGTAAMLRRLAVASSTDDNLIGGVLVKFAKPGQDLRVDLPSIGPDTVDQAHAAGLAGVVVEAGCSLILDKKEVIRRANALGLFILGRKRTSA